MASNRTKLSSQTYQINQSYVFSRYFMWSWKILCWRIECIFISLFSSNAYTMDICGFVLLQGHIGEGKLSASLLYVFTGTKW